MYGGEDREPRPHCDPEKHQFSVNDRCCRCKASKSGLVNLAHRILRRLAPEDYEAARSERLRVLTVRKKDAEARFKCAEQELKEYEEEGGLR